MPTGYVEVTSDLGEQFPWPAEDVCQIAVDLQVNGN